jgi:hypothetical protein
VYKELLLQALTGHHLYVYVYVYVCMNVVCVRAWRVVNVCAPGVLCRVRAGCHVRVSGVRYACVSDVVCARVGCRVGACSVSRVRVYIFLCAACLRVGQHRTETCRLLDAGST